MAIYVLLSGILHRDVVSRISQNGNRYATCNVRVEQDGQTLWVNVICFDEAAQDELMRLKSGDALSIQGKATPGVYVKDDEARPTLQVTALAVTPLQPKPKAPRNPVQPRRQASMKLADKNPSAQWNRPADADPFDDPLEF